MFIIDAIKKIKNSKRTTFVVPAHLWGNIIPSNMRNLIGKKAFFADVSEIDGLDNLKNPQNCILNSQNRASEIYDTKATFYLTNGSSIGILASLSAILKENDKVLVPRNVHESVFNGLVLTGALPVWFLPDYDEEFDIYKGITLKQIESEYKKNPDVKALIITSPTYEGVVAEIKEISEFCRVHDIIFIVDEAHGALFPFSDKLPKSAVKLGADIVIHSLHKTAPALTGSALLHVGKTSRILPEIIRKNLNLISSTSPSWLIIASIEGAIEFLNSNRGKRELDTLLLNINNFKQQNNLYFEFLNNDDVTKLMLKKNGVSGEELSDFLSKNNIEDELVTYSSTLLICGIGTTKKKLKKLSHCLQKFRPKILTNNIQLSTKVFVPDMKLSPKVAFNSKFEIIKKENSVGRIIGENITPYPPCIPILMAGEVIEKEHLDFLPSEIKVIL